MTSVVLRQRETVMATVKAAIGSAAFLVAAPGVVAGVIPWLLTDWGSSHPPVAARVLGGVLVVAGVAVIVHAFARFVSEGTGTPAPVAPTQRLVVGGAYRYVRNPMYVAVGTTIIGQAVLLGRASLLGYAAIFFAVVVAFVRGYEEPLLAARYGEEYRAYRAAVPGWRPRLRPWTPE